MAHDAILITGGAGFIGGTFVRQWLAEEEARLVNLDALTYAADRQAIEERRGDKQHVFVEGDICDGKLVASLLAEHQPRGVIHFAAESHVDRSIENPSQFVQTNVFGTFTLLDESLRYWKSLSADDKAGFRFVHVSTDEVYGSADAGETFDETSPAAPNSPYAASKASSDQFVRAYFRTYGLPTIITRASNNYGPYQFPEKLIPLMILNAIEGKPLPVYGDGLQVRDWMFVEDHCRGIREVLARGVPGEAYNIAAGEDLTNLEIVKRICGLVDRLRPGLAHSPCEKLLTHVTDRPGHDRRYSISAAKMARELGWRPRWNLAAGLEATVRWYLDNPAWVDRIGRGLDARRRLGIARSTSNAAAADRRSTVTCL